MNGWYAIRVQSTAFKISRKTSIFPAKHCESPMLVQTRRKYK